MSVEAAMGQADLFHDLGDARAVIPSSPSSARGGRDDPFVGDFLAAWGGPPGGGSAHMMSIIYQTGAERQGATRRPAGAGGVSPADPRTASSTSPLRLHSHPTPIPKTLHNPGRALPYQPEEPVMLR